MVLHLKASQPRPSRKPFSTGLKKPVSQRTRSLEELSHVSGELLTGPRKKKRDTDEGVLNLFLFLHLGHLFKLVV